MSAILRRHVILGQRSQPAAVSLSELYHENSKLHPALLPSGQTGPDPSRAEREAMLRGYKRYGRHPQVPLRAVEALPHNPARFDEVVARRRSAREFGPGPLGLPALATVLRQACGITGAIELGGGLRLDCRAAPSAGALYPAEVYLGVRDVAGLRPGVYHYEVHEHSLALLRDGDPTAQLREACLQQPHAEQAAVVVLISGVVERTRRKYGERGYRFVLLEVGHLAQNLQLASTALGLGFVALGGYYDDMVNELLQLHGVDETILYVGFLGNSVEREVR